MDADYKAICSGTCRVTANRYLYLLVPLSLLAVGCSSRSTEWHWNDQAITWTFSGKEYADTILRMLMVGSAPIPACPDKTVSQTRHGFRVLRKFEAPLGEGQANTSFIEYGWKVYLTNTSDRQLHMAVEYFILDSDGFRVHKSRLDELTLIPGVETVVAHTAITHASNISRFVSSTVKLYISEGKDIAGVPSI